MEMAMVRSLLFLCMFAVWVQVESRPIPSEWDTNYNYAGAEHNLQHDNFGDSSHDVVDFSSGNLESEFRVKNPSSFELGEGFTYGSGAKYSEAADSGRFSANLYSADRPRIVSRDEQFQALYSYNPEQSNDESQVDDEPRKSSFNANRFESNGDGNDVDTDQSSSFASRDETYRFDAATTTTETNFGNDASETYALLATDFTIDGSRRFERAAPESRFGDVSEEHFGDSSTYTFDATRVANDASGLTLAEAPVSFDSEEHFGDVSTSSLPSSGFTRVADPPSGFDANEDEFSFSPEDAAFELAHEHVWDYAAQAPASAANFDDALNHNASETELAPWSYDAKTDEWNTRTFQMAEAPESFHVDESNETASFFTENSTRTASSDADSPAPAESFDFSEVSFNAEYARVPPKQEDEAEAPQKSDDSSTYTNSLTNVTSEAAEAPGSSEGSNFQEFSTDTHMSNDSRSNAEDDDEETFADVDSHSLSSSETLVKDSEVTPSDSFTITMPSSFSSHDDDFSSHQMFAHTTLNSKPAHTFEGADDAP